MRSLSIGATGMLAQQTNVDVISNNIANMNIPRLIPNAAQNLMTCCTKILFVRARPLPLHRRWFRPAFNWAWVCVLLRFTALPAAQA